MVLAGAFAGVFMRLYRTSILPLSGLLLLLEELGLFEVRAMFRTARPGQGEHRSQRRRGVRVGVQSRFPHKEQTQALPSIADPAKEVPGLGKHFETR
jgi:hypothetical protein